MYGSIRFHSMLSISKQVISYITVAYHGTKIESHSGEVE